MSHFNSKIILTRLKNLKSTVCRRILGEKVLLDAQVGVSQDPTPWKDRLALDYRSIEEGDAWGGTWQSGWFHLSGRVPEAWSGKKVVARLDIGGEALLVDENGEPQLGLTDGSSFDVQYAKDILHLFDEAEGGEKVSLVVEAAANRLFGVEATPEPEFMDDPDKLHGHHRGIFKAARLHVFDENHWHLHLDLEVLINLYETLPEKSRRKATLLREMNRAATAYDHGGAIAAREALRPALEMPTDPSEIQITAVGHAHIDTGWLWPVRETIRKCARTYSSALNLMERYPDYTFGASQPAHYQMMKEHHPELYEKIRRSVAEGRWELQGGMWVEADCNLISGESMVRQFLQGKHFFMDEFGKEVENLWLPDVFGYSAQLPQILAKSGCPAFVTQKLSWGLYTTFPHHTFNWKGIDGSTVVAHFPPEDNYNSHVLPNQVKFGAQNYKEADICDEALCLFGIGDGGGGPKEEHIERARRMADLNGLPKMKMGPAQPLMDRFIEMKNDLDTWTGELYLEMHRGTLTTQARTKWLNRRLEESLRATEELCCRVGMDAYPAKELREIWRMMLLNQFHDIIPGSSIHWVYEVSEKEMEDGLARCEELRRLALPGDASDTLSLVNPASTRFDDHVELPSGWEGASFEGKALMGYKEGGVSKVRVRLEAGATIALQRGRGLLQPEKSSDLILSNEKVKAVFNAEGRLVIFQDLVRDMDLIPREGEGNVLRLYEDRPHVYDAWEVDEYYRNSELEQAEIQSLQGFTAPGLRGLKVEFKIGNSSVQQTITLRDGSARLDFETTVDWREEHKMLRVDFPTELDCDEASFEIQYGVVRRPTRRNSTADVAKFEVCGHRFADLSRADQGLALLNNGKYGYRVVDGNLDLNPS